MDESSHRTKRLLAVAAATVVSLACGTNYAYSAWAPQFAQKLQLTATESNLIGTAGNVGMYASGIPFGYMVDTRGPRLNTVIGSVLLGVGYYPLYWAYENGKGSMGVPMLFFFSFLTGAGSCSAFSASIKTAALNWPHHRGTATSFPLAAFGLSAVFYTTISGILFPSSVQSYLLLLTFGTFCMCFFPVFFISVPAEQKYTAVSADEYNESENRRDSNVLHRPKSWKSVASTTSDPNKPAAHSGQTGVTANGDASEISSLLSSESIPGDIDPVENSLKNSVHSNSHHGPDITGLALLPTVEFWLLWSMLGILTGIGLMTINNIGNDSNALWRYYAPDTDPDYILQRQLMHVSIISIMSFCGRLLSGIGSDFLVKKHHLSRFWCLVISSSIFAVAQVLALSIVDPNYLWLLSSISGLGYGFLFGVYPALIADAFGVSGLSMNWGYMTIAPVIFGNIFNLLYGGVFDSHSIKGEDGNLVCEVGLDCYRNAYVVTAIGSVLAIGLSVLTAWRDGRKLRRLRDSLNDRLD
ncbi:MFS general substrate transporter [Microthyrium microscopicum]|uniref:MFS general substrate transporter n=1 Tax=Microthyrium microscopicum TaxID=703497 RepID=A0A6A6U023_9PEZI|nr:MFS general substrate transporter [Microthyrium microscopicum]